MKVRRVFIQVEADSDLPIKEIKHYVKKKLDIVILDLKESSKFTVHQIQVNVAKK